MGFLTLIIRNTDMTHEKKVEKLLTVIAQSQLLSLVLLAGVSNEEAKKIAVERSEHLAEVLDSLS